VSAKMKAMTSPEGPTKASTIKFGFCRLVNSPPRHPRCVGALKPY
jgi:hypothetical protein